jgi:DNA polymerase-3 subunit beta
VNISKSFLTKIFNKIIPCINPNEQNPVLNGILLDTSRENGIIESVGTDGYHLAYVKDTYNGEKFKIIINIETIKQISELLTNNDESISLYLKNSQAIIEIKDSIMLCRLIEGTFPSAIKTIEAINPYYFNINKNDLINAVDRGLILASGEKKPSVLLNVSQNKIRITCRSIEYGSSYEEINTDTNLQESVSISLNAKLLFDLIKNVDHQDIRFELTSASRPIIIKDQTDSNYASLILPIRNI